MIRFLDKLIYVPAIKFKTCKKAVTVSGGGLFNVHTFVLLGCAAACAHRPRKHNSLMSHMPESHHQTLSVRCVMSVISHRFL